SKRSVRPDAPVIPVDMDPPDRLDRRLRSGARTYDAHRVAVIHESERLTPHPFILGIRVVPEEHDHAPSLRARLLNPCPSETGDQARYHASAPPSGPRPFPL